MPTRNASSFLARLCVASSLVPALPHRADADHHATVDAVTVTLKRAYKLHLDASRHDWLEGRGPDLSLLAGIDDTTGKVPRACFREQEDAHGYFQVLRHTVSKHGIPMAVYGDRHSVFFQTVTGSTRTESVNSYTVRVADLQHLDER